MGSNISADRYLIIDIVSSDVETMGAMMLCMVNNISSY